MTFEQALEKGYIIVVSNGVVARELNKRYKTRQFASVNSGPFIFDGVKGIFIDEWISGLDKAIELSKRHINVIIGPLHA